MEEEEKRKFCEIRSGSAKIGIRASFLIVLRLFKIILFAILSLGTSAASYITFGLRIRCGR